MPDENVSLTCTDSVLEMSPMASPPPKKQQQQPKKKKNLGRKGELSSSGLSGTLHEPHLSWDLQATTRLQLSAHGTMILGEFTFLEKGVDLTKARALECSAGCPDRFDLGQQSRGSPRWLLAMEDANLGATVCPTMWLGTGTTDTDGVVLV